MQKFLKPKDLTSGEQLNTPYTICRTLFEGYLKTKPIPVLTKDITPQVRREWMGKFFKKIQEDETLFKSFCTACDKENMPIPFEK